MKTVIIVFVVVVLMAGCASTGKMLDTDKLTQIKPGVTTKAEMIEWFGSPFSQVLDTSGKLVLLWYYNKVQSYVFTFDLKQQMLSVLFDTNDVVEKLSLIDDVNK